MRTACRGVYVGCISSAKNINYINQDIRYHPSPKYFIWISGKLKLTLKCNRPLNPHKGKVAEEGGGGGERCGISYLSSAPSVAALPSGHLGNNCD